MIHPSAGSTGIDNHTLWTMLLAWSKYENVTFVWGRVGVCGVVLWQISLFPCLPNSDIDSSSQHLRVCVPLQVLTALEG